MAASISICGRVDIATQEHEHPLLHHPHLIMLPFSLQSHLYHTNSPYNLPVPARCTRRGGNGRLSGRAMPCSHTQKRGQAAKNKTKLKKVQRDHKVSSIKTEAFYFSSTNHTDCGQSIYILLYLPAHLPPSSSYTACTGNHSIDSFLWYKAHT